jgi:uncharacterized protein
MAKEVSYPGVYIQETGSAAQSILGVPTSLAAFAGRTAWGPIDGPERVQSFGEFERLFGPPSAASPLGWAVRDFFANGGGEAAVVRLFEPDPRQPSAHRVARLAFAAPGGSAPFVLAAADPGTWGNALAAEIDRAGINAATAAQFDQYGLAPEDLFNLTLIVRNAAGVAVRSERFLNLTVRDGGGPARIDGVLNSQSRLARLDAALPTLPPGDGSAQADGGGNDGTWLTSASYLGDRDSKTGLYQLEKLDLFNLLCLPPDRPDGDLELAVLRAAARYCRERRAFYIVDPPAGWADLARQGLLAAVDPSALGIEPADATYAAVYFPRILPAGQGGALDPAAPCGAVAGVYARTDTSRGVWKAPAGLDAGIAGSSGLEVALTDTQNGRLNPIGVNCLRTFPTAGPVVWGARTLAGADNLASDFKYVPVRRLALFIEESIFRGTQFAVFEPNGEPLWAALRLAVGTFTAGLERQGAFYDCFVRCDATTTSQADIDAGVVNVLVGFAPLKPAEFLVVNIRLLAGQGI